MWLVCCSMCVPRRKAITFDWHNSKSYTALCVCEWFRFFFFFCLLTRTKANCCNTAAGVCRPSANTMNTLFLSLADAWCDNGHNKKQFRKTKCENTTWTRDERRSSDTKPLSGQIAPHEQQQFTHYMVNCRNCNAAFKMRPLKASLTHHRILPYWSRSIDARKEFVVRV